MMAYQKKRWMQGYRQACTAAAVGVLTLVAPIFSSHAGMDMPSYGKAMTMAEEGSSEVEMGKRFGKFMEGFSRQMDSGRGEEAGRAKAPPPAPPPAPVYREERAYPSERYEDYRNGSRQDSYSGDRRYNEDRYRERRSGTVENPYRYDPWGARYWGGNPWLEQDPWGGYSPYELYDQPHYGDYGSGWGYAPPYGGGYGPGYGYGYNRPGREYYGEGDGYYGGEGRGYGTYDRRRPYSMSFDNPWDTFWPRSWPFNNRSWDW